MVFVNKIVLIREIFLVGGLWFEIFGFFLGNKFRIYGFVEYGFL